MRMLLALLLGLYLSWPARAADSGPDPAAAKGAADGAGTAAVDGPAAGPDAPLAEGSPAAGPSCTVSMGEVPQAGVWAPQRDDWGKVAWFAVTVRLPLSR
ncbi:hypothetical protein [Desulfovibrio piger]|uniref:hypothetical protein n=1 Tax=Desulfovibrio piger TaxID=901 RepID=UPI003AB2E975